MSDILIKGMEMPKGLGKTITIYPNGTVRVWVNNKGSGELLEQRAVSVPEHGDLIDRDKLEKDIDKYIGGEESRSRFHHWVQVQRSVILKSEEEQT